MSLYSLADELLLQIFSEHDVLDQLDYMQIVHTCRRFYRIALPHYYYSVRLPWANQHPPSQSLLANIEHRLNCYSHRAAWIHEACVSWNYREDTWTEKIFEALIQMPTLERLNLLEVERSEQSMIHSPVALSPGFPTQNSAFTKFLERCSELSTLQTVDIRNQHLSAYEISKLYEIPQLKNLKVGKFDDHPEDAAVISANIPPSALTKLEFWRSSEPMGRKVELLLGNHPNLEELAWNIETSYPLYSEEAALYLPCSPDLEARLVKLQLSLHDTQNLRGGFELDFTRFSALEELDVHQSFLFGDQSWPMVTCHDRWTVVDRLPASLKSLIITFDRDSYALRGKKSDKTDFGWILALAQRKKSLFKNLSQVKTIERSEYGYVPCGVVDLNLREWAYPPQIRDAFQDAQIELEVLLRG